MSVPSMNIATFIREIYNALKNLEIKYIELSDTVNKKLIKIDAEYTNIRNNIGDIREEMTNINTKLDNMNNLKSNIGADLETHMRLLNSEINTTKSEKINLSLNEMTIENLLENNYNLADIENLNIPAKTNIISGVDITAMPDTTANLDANSLLF